MTIRWGFLGTGRIATRVSEDVLLTDGGVRFAVASRDSGRAETFAAEHGFQRSYGSYRELIHDPEVDVVYVATPHGQHHRDASAALRAGKPTVVEKSFTVSSDAARDLVRIAHEKGVFLMEAMWMRFQPLMAELKRVIEDGAIGRIRSIHADFSLEAPFDPSSRFWDASQGGGALLDRGVYPISFAHMLLGKPSSVSVEGSLSESGVDEHAALLLRWPDNEIALLSCSIVATSEISATIAGTEGLIRVDPWFFRSEAFTIHRDGEDPQVFQIPLIGAGFVHELNEVHECLERGLTESMRMPLADTLEVMDILDGALSTLGASPLDDGFDAA